MIPFLKALCVAVYALAIASLFGTLPLSTGPVLQFLAIAMVAVHALEAVMVFKYIKSYPGSLAVSLVLALLFGLLHWMPLARANHSTTPST